MPAVMTAGLSYLGVNSKKRKRDGLVARTMASVECIRNASSHNFYVTRQPKRFRPWEPTLGSGQTLFLKRTAVVNTSIPCRQKYDRPQCRAIHKNPLASYRPVRLPVAQLRPIEMDAARATVVRDIRTVVSRGSKGSRLFLPKTLVRRCLS